MARHMCEVQEFDQAYFIKSLCKTGFIEWICMRGDKFLDDKFLDNVFGKMIFDEILNNGLEMKMLLKKEQLSSYAIEAIARNGNLSFIIQSPNRRFNVFCDLISFLDVYQLVFFTADSKLVMKLPRLQIDVRHDRVVRIERHMPITELYTTTRTGPFDIYGSNGIRSQTGAEQ